MRPAAIRRRLLKSLAGAPLLGACASSPSWPSKPPGGDVGNNESSATAASAAISPASAPSIPLPGTRWIYREINRYNGRALGDLQIEVVSAAPLVLRHSRVNPSNDAGQIAAPDGPAEARYSEPWSILVDPWFDRVLRFESPVPLLPPAMTAGSSVATSSRFSVDGNSGRYVWHQRLRIVGNEILSTPAGRFDCFVLERLIHFDSPDPFTFDRQRSETRWYSPAINGWVKREWTGDYLDRGNLDDRFGRRREDWVRLELQAFMASPIGERAS